MQALRADEWWRKGKKPSHATKEAENPIYRRHENDQQKSDSKAILT